jgi:flagellar hook-associated protein 2
MTTTSSSATYDPATTATQLAGAYTSARQATLTQQTDRATATSAALAKLGTGLADFTATLAALSGKKSLLANSAAFSDAGVGTATASPSAAAGSYAFFVERLATAHQVAYSGLADSTAADSGILKIAVGAGTPISIDLTAANKDGDTLLSPKEIAAAINGATGNNGKVTASILTVNGVARLVLNASSTGAASAITLDTSGITNGAVKGALDAPANFKEMTAAQDAIVWLDAADAASGGTMLQQASNTYTVVDGVSMTFTKAQAAGTAPVTMTVASDAAGSVSNVQAFVDAYNKLQKLVVGQTYAGDPSKGVAGGAFANDAGVNALKTRLASAIRNSVNGMTLAKYGITASRDGSLSVNSTTLKSALATNPAGLDQVFGSATVGAKSGVMGELDKYVSLWNNSANGQITVRKASVSKQQTALVVRQATLDNQYNSAYKRYLTQFTALQAVQAQMASTTTMFDAMFNNSKS